MLRNCRRIPSIHSVATSHINRYGFKSFSNEIKRINQVHIEKTPITKLLWKNRIFNTDNEIAKQLAIHGDKIIERSSIDSSLSIKYDFKDNALLRETYSDSRGFMLLGKLFEDLDAFAGNIALKHCSSGDDESSINKNISLVTASVDKITSLKKSLPITHDDYLLIGQVVWTGNSSMDIFIEMHSQNAVMLYNNDGIPSLLQEGSRLLSSFYTFVARDRLTGKGRKVNSFKPISDIENQLYNERKTESELRRLHVNNVCLDNDTNNKDIILQLVEKGCANEDMPALSHPSQILMRNTMLENTFICHPQNCNTAGRVFGGYLMHKAYDLAFSTCYTFAGAYPIFRQVDKVIFKKPVDIGDLVRMKSRVVFTTENPINQVAVVEVTCQIVRPEIHSSQLSNTFTFEFGFGESVTLRRILPLSNEEAISLIRASKSVN